MAIDTGTPPVARPRATDRGETLTVRDDRTGKTYVIPIQDGAIRATELNKIRTAQEWLANEHAREALVEMKLHRVPLGRPCYFSDDTGDTPSSAVLAYLGGVSSVLTPAGYATGIYGGLGSQATAGCGRPTHGRTRITTGSRHGIRARRSDRSAMEHSPGSSTGISIRLWP